MKTTKAHPGLVPLSDAYFVPTEEVEPSPFQPREFFDPEKQQELADNIKENGVLQPVLLRPVKNKSSQGIRFQLVYGERRWRACQLISRAQIPAIVRELSDIKAQELALNENIKHESLTDWEEAKGIKNLWIAYEEAGEEMSQRKMARKVNMSVSFVGKRMNMLGWGDKSGWHSDVQAVAKKHRGVLSSCELINQVEEEEARAKLLTMVDDGKSFRDVKAAIEKDEAKAKADEARKKESRATDVDSRKAQSARSARQREADRELKAALSEAETKLQTAAAWWEYVDSAEYSAQIERVRQQIEKLQ